MMFSATSLAEDASSDGERSRGSVPLMGLEVTISPRRLRKSSGDRDATAPHVPATKAARAGAVRVTASTKKSMGAPDSRPVKRVQTQA